MKLPHHTPEYLRERLAYDPFDGTLWWKWHNGPDPRWMVRYSGKQAFTTIDSEGYYEGWLDGAKYRAHRLIWALVRGKWPTHQIDHIDHNRNNNMLHNLREATQKINGQNMSRATNNTSGVTGVWFDKANQKWVAEIKVDQKKRHIGRYTDIEDARYARIEAEIALGFHVNHGN